MIKIVLRVVLKKDGILTPSHLNNSLEQQTLYSKFFGTIKHADLKNTIPVLIRKLLQLSKACYNLVQKLNY